MSASAPLFVLDPSPEKTTRDEADRRVAQARANLEDAKKGRRAPEIESLEALLRQVRAALVRSESALVRVEETSRTGVGAVDDLENARSARDQDRARVARPRPTCGRPGSAPATT